MAMLLGVPPSLTQPATVPASLRKLAEMAKVTYSISQPGKKPVAIGGNLLDVVMSEYWDFYNVRVPPASLQLGPLKLLRHIGGGAYGAVYSATVNEGGVERPLVVKLYLKKGGNMDPPTEMLREVHINSLVSVDPQCTPTVICMYSALRAAVVNGGKIVDVVYGMVMEEMEGDLVALVVRMTAMPPMNRMGLLMYIALHTFYDILLLHEVGIGHNDIKPGNFLFKTIGRNIRIKAADLGLACDDNPNRGMVLYRSSYKPFLEAPFPLDPSIVIDARLPEVGCELGSTMFYASPELHRLVKSMGMWAPTPSFDVVKRNDVHCLCMMIKEMFSLLDLGKNDIYGKLGPKNTVADMLAFRKTPLPKVIEGQPPGAGFAPSYFSDTIEALQHGAIDLANGVRRLAVCYDTMKIHLARQAP